MREAGRHDVPVEGCSFDLNGPSQEAQRGVDEAAEPARERDRYQRAHDRHPARWHLERQGSRDEQGEDGDDEGEEEGDHAAV